MLPELLALAILASPHCHVSHQKALRIAKISLALERGHKLPVALISSVTLAESGGRKIIARGRGKGKRGCDVGEGQNHVPECEKARVDELRDLETNLSESAKILVWSRKKCEDHPGWKYCHAPAGCIWGGYNWGSRTWCKRVLKIRKQILDYREEQNS